MNRSRLAYVLLLSAVLVSSPAFADHVSSITDSATTSDQATVGTVFDNAGTSAAHGSALELDYTAITDGTDAQISESAQSLLPTTAYNMAGAANALAATEESNIMGRLRNLRHRGEITPSRSVTPSRAPVIYPLQKSDEALHDLRTGKKAQALSNPHGTVSNYRSYSPALYQDQPEQPKEKPSLPERAYNTTMGWAAIGAGAPNEAPNASDQKRVRLVPNMADRVAAKTLNAAADLGGQGRVNETAVNGMPRRVAVLPRDKDVAAANNYPGQPLANLSSSPAPMAVPMATGGPSALSSTNNNPIQLTMEPPRNVTAPSGTAPSNDPLNPLPPMVYGPDDAAVPAQAVPEQPAAPVRKAAPFVYKRIDQDSGLTTPQLGSPSSSRSTMTIRQNNALALVSSQETNVKLRAAQQKTTDTGTFLWTNDRAPDPTNTQPAAPAETAAEANAALVSYGTTAVPLQEPANFNADSRWGFFVTGTTGFGNDELQQTSEKTKTTTAGFTTGADYRLNATSYTGLALTYVHSSMTTGNFGDLQSNSTSLSLYGTTAYATHAYVDGYISVGYLNMDSERTIFAAGDAVRKAKGDPDGFQFSGKAETGYDFKQADWTYGPFAGFRLAYADFGDYTEKDAASYNLKVQGFNNLSAIGNLGVNASHRYVMANGGVLMPSLRVGYNHEFGDDQSNIKAEFINAANSAFSTKSNKKSRDWVNVSPAITASLPNDWTLAAQYEHDFFRDDVNENIFNLTAHYRW